MNDFYKKSLSELLYETNDDNFITTKNLQNEQFVYKKGVVSLLNESTNLFSNAGNIQLKEFLVTILETLEDNNIVRIINKKEAKDNTFYLIKYNEKMLYISGRYIIAHDLSKPALMSLFANANIDSTKKEDRSELVINKAKLIETDDVLVQGFIKILNETPYSKLTAPDDISQEFYKEFKEKQQKASNKNPEGSSDPGGEEGEKPEESQGASESQEETGDGDEDQESEDTEISVEDKAKKLFNDHFAEDKIAKTTGPDNIRLNYVKAKSDNIRTDFIIYDEKQESYYIFEDFFSTSGVKYKFKKYSEKDLIDKIEDFVRNHSDDTLEFENFSSTVFPNGDLIKKEYNSISQSESDEDQDEDTSGSQDSSKQTEQDTFTQIKSYISNIDFDNTDLKNIAFVKSQGLAYFKYENEYYRSRSTVSEKFDSEDAFYSELKDYVDNNRTVEQKSIKELRGGTYRFTKLESTIKEIAFKDKAKELFDEHFDVDKIGETKDQKNIVLNWIKKDRNNLGFYYIFYQGKYYTAQPIGNYNEKGFTFAISEKEMSKNQVKAALQNFLLNIRATEGIEYQIRSSELSEFKPVPEHDDALKKAFMKKFNITEEQADESDEDASSTEQSGQGGDTGEDTSTDQGDEEEEAEDQDPQGEQGQADESDEDEEGEEEEGEEQADQDQGSEEESAEEEEGSSDAEKKEEENFKKFVEPRVKKVLGMPLKDIEQESIKKVFDAITKLKASGSSSPEITFQDRGKNCWIGSGSERIFISFDDLSSKALLNKIDKKCLDYYSKNKEKFDNIDNGSFTSELLNSMIKSNVNFLAESYLYKNSLSTLLFESSTSMNNLRDAGFNNPMFLSGLFNYIAYGNLDYIENAESDTATMASRTLAARIKRNNEGLTDKSDITEEDIRRILEQDLQRIVVGTIRAYDEERYNDLMSKSKSEEIKKKKEKEGEFTENEIIGVTGGGFLGVAGAAMYGLGALGVTVASPIAIPIVATAGGALMTGSLIKNYLRNKNLTDEKIEDRLKDVDPAHFETTGSQYIRDQIKDELDTLIDILLEIVKEDKDMLENKNLFVGSISKLLFEANKKEEVTLDLIKDYLRGSGILFYEQGQKGEQLKDIENRLANTLAAMLRTHFNVKVKNANSSSTIDTKTPEVESMVDKDAERGQPASQDVAQGFAGMPIPTNMDSPGSIDQLAMLANMSGGNMMFMFMMMMMNQNFMQMMMQMQNNGASLNDMSKKVAEESGEEEMSDFDKYISDALKDMRSNLPVLSKKKVKEIYNLVTSNPFTDLDFCKNFKFNSSLKDQKLFVKSIKEHFNITGGEVKFDDKTGSKLRIYLFKSLDEETKKDAKIKQDFQHNSIEAFALHCFADKILNIDSVSSSRMFNKDKIAQSLLGSVTYKDDDTENQYIQIIGSGDKKSKSFIKDKEEEVKTEILKHFDETKKQVENIVKKYLIETSGRYNHPVLRRRVPKKKIINESEFLKKEFKRLWKL